MLTLRDGQGSSRGIEFEYVVERSKSGPRIVLEHQKLIIDHGAVQIVGSSVGEALRVAPDPVPGWIEIDGVKFGRQSP